MTSATTTLPAPPAAQRPAPALAGVELTVVPAIRDCYICGGSDGEHYKTQRVAGLAFTTSNGIPVYRLACRHNAL